MYNSDDIDNLIENLKIEEVVGEFVELVKSGSNYKGLCPFHSDTNPSFTVSPTKNICKCFVCGSGGNPVTFYSKYKKISFFDAAEELSKKYNIKLRKINSKKKDEKIEKYYIIMDEAHKYFREEIFSLNGRGALKYLTDRNLLPKDIHTFQIGYARNAWDGLYQYLSNKGYTSEEMLTLGLIKVSSSDKFYDSFRDRVIFPIYSPQGQVIAFGGRALQNTPKIAKYINSPDTPIFKKGLSLYGLERGLTIKKKNYSILMEGYMDVISATQHGLDVALAPLGTALTVEQCKLLKRYTDNVILSFDADSAGIMATEKSSFILKSLGFNIRVLKIEDAKDPDEYLSKFGKASFLNLVKNSQEIFDFLFELYAKDYNLQEVISKQKFVERFKDFFNSITKDLEKQMYLQKLSKQIDIDERTLEKTFSNYKRSKYNNVDLNTTPKKGETQIPNKFNTNYMLEVFTLKLMYNSKEDKDFFMNMPFLDPLILEILEFLKNAENKENAIDNLFLIKELKKFSQEKISEVEVSEIEKNKIADIIMTCVEGYTNSNHKEADFIEVCKSWFNILKKKRVISNSMLKELEIAKLENNFKKTTNKENLFRLYRKYSDIISLS